MHDGVGVAAGDRTVERGLCGVEASGGLIQRRMDLPNATVLVLQGVLFVATLFSETFYGRFKAFNPDLWKRRD